MESFKKTELIHKRQRKKKEMVHIETQDLTGAFFLVVQSALHTCFF